jgi:hypothetical protein
VALGNPGGVILPASAWAGSLLNIPPPADGATLDVYSNLSNGSCANGTWLGSDNWGLEMQCTEFGVRAADYEWHTGGSAAWANAGWVGGASDMYRVAANLGLQQYPNGGGEMPQLGDLLIIADAGVGHVGVVQSLSQGRVNLVGQNQGYAINNSITYSGATLDSSRFVVGSTVLGWVRGTLSPYPVISQKSPPPASLRSPYSYSFRASGTPRPTFAQANGTLPPGLTLSSSGVLSGTPTRPGSYAFSVRATNSLGDAVTPTLTLDVPTPGLSGDVNGDGKVDVIAVNYNPSNGTGSAWVMPSTGPTFGTPQAWSSLAFNGTAAVLAGDVNGDGKADLVAVNYDPASGSGSVWVMTSNGRAFNAPQPWSSKGLTGTSAMVTGDVNGDGKADLIAVNYDWTARAGSTWVMTSTGTGFNAPQLWTSQAFNGTSSILSGDVNGDGRADLVAVSYNATTNTGSSSVMMSTGTGFGAPEVWSTQAFNGNSALLIGDVNGDHRADLIGVNYNPANNTGSTWVMTSTATGFGAPQAWSNQPFNGSASMLVGDVNGDKNADVVAVNYDSSTNTGSTWTMVSSGASFNAPQAWSSRSFNGTAAILAGDVNGDGKVDLIAVNYDAATATGSTWVATSTGSAFNTPQAWSSLPFNGTSAIRVGDVNGDGRSDLIAVSYDPSTGVGSTSVMTSTGTAFAPAQTWSGLAFNGTAAILAGDVNGDGKADLIAVNYSAVAGSGSTWVMTSTGTGFTPPQLWASLAFNGSSAILAADVSGDGKTDLIAVNSGNTWVMTSNGASFNAPRAWSSAPFGGTSAAVLAGDINGDGKVDLLAVSYNAANNVGSTAVMTSTTGAGFNAPAVWSNQAFHGTSAVLAGDVNGDKIADLVAVNYNPSSGAGSTWAATVIPPNSPPVAFGAAQLGSVSPFFGNRAVP